jgi:hypothetical protein
MELVKSLGTVYSLNLGPVLQSLKLGWLLWILLTLYSKRRKDVSGSSLRCITHLEISTEKDTLSHLPVKRTIQVQVVSVH